MYRTICTRYICIQHIILVCTDTIYGKQYKGRTTPSVGSWLDVSQSYPKTTSGASPVVASRGVTGASWGGGIWSGGIGGGGMGGDMGGGMGGGIPRWRNIRILTCS